MNSAAKRWAFGAALILIVITLFPVIAANVTLVFGRLKGDGFAGGLLLALMANTDGPASIIQKAIIPILGLIGAVALWREKGRYAGALIVLCLAGVLLTQILWFHLSDRTAAADLWQESSGPLNGTTFPDAMNTYLKWVTIGLIAVMLEVLGVKGLQWLRGES